MTSDPLVRALDLFERALEQPREERESFVESESGEDAALRNRVLAMLRADAGDSPMLDAAPNELASALATGPPPALDGRSIGPYTITAMLGRGGMGIVYLAKRQDVDKLVALKLVAGGLASPDRIARFIRERRVLAQLEHPHIARLLDAGVTEDGTPWFAMEYVPGRPIDEFCDLQRLTIDQRLTLFEQVCSAVAYAHQHLVVHRDLKPSNILVAANGEARLVDFGIAKLMSESAHPAEVVTATHSLPLTPQYASPEQIQGEPITTASDVYQLGALLFELLTGRPPHPERLVRLGERADVAVTKPSNVVLRGAATDRGSSGDSAPAPDALAGLRQTTPERLRRRLSGDLDNIVLRATHLEPPRRYATTEQLADDIRRHIEGMPVLAKPTTAAYRMNRFVRRHKVGTAIAAGAVLALAGFVFAMAEQTQRIEAQRVRAEQVTTLLSDLFTGADPAETQGDTVSVTTLLERGAERLRAGLTSDPEVKGRLLAIIAYAYKNLGQLPRSTELQSEAVDALRSTLAADHPTVLHSMATLAGLLVQTGDKARAKSLSAEMVPVARSLPASRRYDLAKVLASDGFIRQLTSDDSGARRAYEEALAVYRTVPDSFSLPLEETLVNLGYIELNRGNAQRAEQLWREAVELRVKRLGGNHSQTAKTMLDLSAALVQLNKLDEAERIARDAVSIQKRVFRRPNTDVVGGLSALSEVLGARGKFAEAESTQRVVLPLLREVWGDSSQPVANATVNLAIYAQRQGRLDEAEQLNREALRRFTMIAGLQSRATAIVMTNLAYTLYLQRSLDESAALYRDAISTLDVTSQGTPQLAQALTDFAVVLRERGNNAEGATHARRALALRTSLGVPGLTIYPQRVLGTCLVRVGRYAEAESLLVDAHKKLMQGFGPEHQYTQGSTQDLVQLYQLWGKPEKAREYQVSAKGSS
jgi:serine/threonine-protein kinase